MCVCVCVCVCVYIYTYILYITVERRVAVGIDSRNVGMVLKQVLRRLPMSACKCMYIIYMYDI
jgi:hypothetical protein